MKKRILSFVTSLLMILSLGVVMPTNLDVSANCTANDLLSVAKGEVGVTSGYHQRNKYTLWLGKIPRYDDDGYGYPWCSTFVSWCAYKSGCLDVISKTASCNDQWKNTSGEKYYPSSGYSPKPGDLIFYDYGSSNSESSLDHVGIVESYDSSSKIVHTIEGNYSNSVARVNRNYYSNDIYGFISPNYNNSYSVPTNVKLSKNQIWYDIKDTIELTPSSNGGTSYFMSVVKDGKKIINGVSLNGTYRFAASKYGYGNYHAWITACNSAGSTDSQGIDFSVVGAATYSNVWTSKPIYTLTDTVSISVDTVCAKGQIIGIDKDGKERVVTESCNSTYTIAAKKLGTGTYSAYFSVYNGSGGVDTKRVEFVIAKPTNLGDEFYARIKNTTANKYFTVSGTNVLGKNIECSKNQIWKFTRFNDGSYKIISTLDNKALDVDNFGNGGNGTNVQVYNNWDCTAQKYYIFKAFGAYYIKPVCCDMYIDMSLSDYNVAVWSGGANWNPQKFAINKVSLSDIGVHKYNSWTVTKKATCTIDGSQTRKCSVCGKTETKAIAKTGHKYGEWTTTKSATCTLNGEKQRKCSVCGNVEKQAINATGHKYTETVVKPTCTEKGYTLHKCSTCGSYYKDTYTNATGHKYGDWTTTKSATCTLNGEKQRKCSVCGNVEKQVINATGHKYSDKWTVDKEPTETESGSKSHHCEKCGDKKDVTEIPSLSHNFGEWTVTIQPTCTEDGEEERVCSDCDEIETRIIPATGHSYSDEWTIDEEPTCTESGSKSRHCTECDEAIDVTEIPALGHEYAKVKTVNPTVFSKGYTLYRCTNCGATIRRNIVPALVSIAKANVSGIKNTTYTGKQIKPAIKVVIGKTVLRNGTDYTVSYGTNKIGRATVKIVGKGKYAGYVVKTFTIAPRSTTISVKSTKKGQIRAAIARRSEATRYQIQYSTNSKFTGAKTVTTSSLLKTFSAKSQKIYYVRVRTISGKYVSGWSAVKKIKVK